MKIVQELGGGIMQKAFRGILSIFIEYASADSFSLIPGHSYFLEKDDELAKTHLKVNLVPLLEEYLQQGYVASFSNHIKAYLQWIESL